MARATSRGMSGNRMAGIKDDVMMERFSSKLVFLSGPLDERVLCTTQPQVRLMSIYQGKEMMFGFSKYSLDINQIVIYIEIK